MTPMLLLTLNAGSSSIKLALYEVRDQAAHEVGRGALDLHRTPLVLRLQLHGEAHALTLNAPVTESLHEVTDALLAELESHHALGELGAVGHRVVHGGLHFHGPVAIDATTLDAIEALTPLAPLHQAHSVRLIRAVQALRPDLPQTASFDTAFHGTQADAVRRFALPEHWHNAGVRRYGFHGLSYAYIARALAAFAPADASGRVVALHLGSGASLCAMLDGRSVDSSMGFSTLDGVPMGTRCGALDAGVVLHLLQAQGLTVQQVEDLLYHRSGLLGLSGVSADVRDLHASPAPAAREALTIFAMRCAGEVARLAASLGGLDALVFTAGIGEHDAALRAMIAERLTWMGLTLDDAANQRHGPCISSRDSRLRAYVLATDEERTIVDDMLHLLEASA
ncbi:MAG: acetate/propionate family kinase [Hydrogenophaga sp.]|uniref:acetate/propionate family kinase n=1 Tax=Hydrogenophaga sp. TaxID=1904254 RepID=UPI001DEF2960|nr:acetate/propionate family kinase [Hydrogenophaga sp.]MBX3611070.1 acetate/propionate family kinase [Hydrogenophaga sp.]